MRYYYAPIRKAKIEALKTTDNHTSWWRCRTMETYTWVGVHSINHLENSVTVSYKTVWEFLTFGLWARNPTAVGNAYSSSTITVKPGSHLDELSSADEEINKLWYVSESEYYSPKTKNKLWVRASSMVSIYRKLSKGSQIQKATKYMILCKRHSVKGKTLGSKNRWVTTWNSRGGGSWQLRWQHEGTLWGTRTALHLNCNGASSLQACVRTVSESECIFLCVN